jgi:ribosomal protein L16 Arg81 hydroxylase
MKYSLLFVALSAFSQGVPTEWEARKKIDELSARVADVETALSLLDLERWKKAEAPGAYAEQYEAAKRQMASARQAMQELRESPERLATAFEIFLRFEAVDHMLDSVREAARKYDDTAAADALEAKLGATLTARDRFRTYLLDLAKERDAQYAVLVKEAQRCRTEVNTPPAPKKTLKTAVTKP